MARIVMEEAPEFTVLAPESILFLKVEEIEEREVEGRDGKPGWTKLEFTFKIMGVQATGDGAAVESVADVIGSKIWGSTSARFTDNPENKLKQWTEAILGMELNAGFELDTDLLIGRECRGITSTYTKRTGGVRHQIDALLPKGEIKTSVGTATSAAVTTNDPWSSTDDTEIPF